MNVSLPDAMKSWVEDRTRDGPYSNVSDYVRDLIRRDHEATQKIAAMQQAVDQGLASGFGDRTVADIRAEARRRLSGE